MTAFYRYVLRFPRSVIALVLAVTVFFGWQAGKVEFNNSIESVLPEGHPAVLQDHEIKQVFNSREMILIGLLHDEGIFNSGTLRKVQDLTRDIWNVTVATDGDRSRLEMWSRRLGMPFGKDIRAILQNGLDVADRGPINNLWLDVRESVDVDENYVRFLDELRLKLSPVSDVRSLAQVDNITATQDDLHVDAPMETVPQSDEELAALAATVFENEMFVNGLVAEDSTGTVILVELSFYYDDHIKLAHHLFQKLEALAAPYEGPEDVRLAGVPMG